uniref:Uncharacterized protein n=1 Tax=Arcella intermedia TaxID=1963864 RepID=A0A6B2LB01_9EUKA
MVAMVTPVLIERFGGDLGGILGSSPTAIIAAVVGLYLELEGDESGLVGAIFNIPVGVAATSLFVYVWRILIPFLPLSWSRIKSLFLLLFVSFSVWVVFACSLIFGQKALEARYPTQSIPIWFGLTTYCIHFLVALTIVFCEQPAPPPQRKPLSPPLILLRGALSSLVIFTAIMLVLVDKGLAGVTTVFPAIFCSTMISLWLTQDRNVLTGVAGPMVLGVLSVPCFALTFYGLATVLRPLLPDAGLLLLCSVLVSYALSVLLVSVPFHFLLQCRKSLAPFKDTFEEDDELIPRRASLAPQRI